MSIIENKLGDDTILLSLEKQSIKSLIKKMIIAFVEKFFSNFLQNYLSSHFLYDQRIKLKLIKTHFFISGGTEHFCLYGLHI